MVYTDSRIDRYHTVLGVLFVGLLVVMNLLIGLVMIPNQNRLLRETRQNRTEIQENREELLDAYKTMGIPVPQRLNDKVQGAKE